MTNWPARLALLCVVIVGACEPAPTSTPEPPGPTTTTGAYPRAATVDLATLAEALPKDANGKPIVLEVGGVALTLGPGRKDAIGAYARCQDALSGCVTKVGDLDRCAADVPRCVTSEPWNEARCCPDACVVAYREERRFGASVFEADNAVFGSTHECFPGLVEMYVAAGGTPELAPRRAR